MGILLAASAVGRCPARYQRVPVMCDIKRITTPEQRATHIAWCRERNLQESKVLPERYYELLGDLATLNLNEVHNPATGFSELPADANEFVRMIRDRVLSHPLPGSGTIPLQLARAAKTAQADLFADSGADLPLFSGTAQKARLEVFKPVQVQANLKLPGFGK